MWMLHDIPLRHPAITRAWDIALSHSSQTWDTLSQDPRRARIGGVEAGQPKMSGGTLQGADELPSRGYPTRAATPRTRRGSRKLAVTCIVSICRPDRAQATQRPMGR